MLISTRYQKSIKPVPSDHVFMLKSGGNNKKLGRRIKKTAWAGAPIFSLTLTERDTCPRSCHHWEDCYGNNMPFAARYSVHDYGAFISRLEYEVDTLIAKHGKIAIRLHVLGDFFSTDYVTFWDEMLCKHDGLLIWGYTARSGCDIDKRLVQSECSPILSVVLFVGVAITIRASIIFVMLRMNPSMDNLSPVLSKLEKLRVVAPVVPVGSLL